ncbi:hypothetical protein VC83_02324 [Pseudogymnoascus destructans]|uniref:SET domain-containing protein n=2 Tax=Pseudogymnoascus destructans TaxID=655981 RepID=L8FQM5_PSED2|nr:uncharacterized protein VC83_02324 [Pseudogymnoascus destructans]ELR03202.1 hypothetical protein GMDG_01185 [Pseudogymnoascus destructans 20631-21]OAF60955.1 hypothetical protein VC83_02324 [Pseudogymnoascus destructans]
MDKHEEFTRWAELQGVELYGIAAHQFPGRGLGIVAKERQEAGKIILTVPISALRTTLTVPKAISIPLGKITAHGLLAADMSLDTDEARSRWRDVLPSQEDFQASMPILWPPILQDFLPQAASALLSNQIKKFELDWATVSGAFPAIDRDHYLYSWLIVNTRTFYYVPPGTKKKKDSKDCMALNPFADYFNHASQGCTVEFGPEGFEITTNKVYGEGEEIYISYGKHSNDFLLAEYGFIMAGNDFDHILLDSVIIPKMDAVQLQLVRDAGYLGKYVLDNECVCYRTEVVLRALCMPARRWERFVDSGVDGQHDQAMANELLIKVLKLYVAKAQNLIEQLLSLEVKDRSQVETLVRRWNQILSFLQGAIVCSVG